VLHQVRCHNQKLPHRVSMLPCACSANGRCSRTQCHYDCRIVRHACPRETALDQLQTCEVVVEPSTKLTWLFQPFSGSSDAQDGMANRLNSLSVTVSRAPARFHSMNLESIRLTGTIGELASQPCAIVVCLLPKKELGCATHRHDHHVTNGLGLRFAEVDYRL
jgi:hypothetical protein